MVSGFTFQISNIVIRVYGLRTRDQGLGMRDWGLEIQVGFGGSGFEVEVLRFSV